MTIETKLHVRDHAMWSQLDQAITRVAGAVDESATPPDSDDEAADLPGRPACCNVQGFIVRFYRIAGWPACLRV